MLRKTTAGDTNVKLRHHIGGAHYVSVTSDFHCVDFRKFYLPYGTKTRDEIRPSHKGIALRLDEWSDLCVLTVSINAEHPSLANAHPCYLREDHMNQVGWLDDVANRQVTCLSEEVKVTQNFTTVATSATCAFVLVSK